MGVGFRPLRAGLGALALRALRLALQLGEELLRVRANLPGALRADVLLDLPPRAPVQLERGEEPLVLLIRPI